MSLRPDIHAVAVSVAALPEFDAAIVLREAEGGNESTLVEAISAQVALDQGLRPARHLAVPEPLSQADHGDAWRASVLRASELPPEQAGLEVALPALCEEARVNAECALVQRDLVRVDLGEAELQLRRVTVQRDYELSLIEAAPPLRHEQVRWGRLSLLLFSIEVLGIFVGVEGYLGVGDGGGFAETPVWTHVIAGGLTLLLASGLAAATFASATLLARVKVGPRVALVAGFAAGGTALGLAVAVAVMRWWGSTDVYTVADSAVDYGSRGFLVGTALASACLTAAASVTVVGSLDYRRRAAAAEAATAAMEQKFAGDVAACRERVDGLGAELMRLSLLTRLPLTLRTAFERGVKQAAEWQRADKTELANRRHQAVGAFRVVRSLAPELRPIVSREVFTLRERVGSGNPAPASRGSSILSRVPDGVAPLCLLLALVAQTACSPPESPPADLIIGCDGTGVSPDDVCTHTLLQQATFHWLTSTGNSPASSETIIMSAGKFGDTSTAIRLQGLEKSSNRADRPRALRTALSDVQQLTVPDDADGSGMRPNRSDLVSLVAVAAREARNGSRAVKLLVATDGWLVSLGVDTESGPVPTPEDFLARIEAAGVTWGLSVFSSVTICGLHNRGAEAGKVGARDRLLAAILRAGKSPEPKLLTSCQGLYPAVPPALLPPVDTNADEFAALTNGAP